MRTAKVAYQEHLDKSTKLLAGLESALAEHMKRAGENPDWGYVGDLAELSDTLQHMFEFMTSTQA